MSKEFSRKFLLENLKTKNEDGEVHRIFKFISNKDKIKEFKNRWNKMEACIKCSKQSEKKIIKQIKKELLGFLKEPNSYKIYYNPTNGLYRLKKVK